jgi:CubicO group peptidase (beta-lactamase class C family)
MSGLNHPPRRRFLIQSGQAALGVSLFPLAACSRPPRPTSEPLDDASQSVIADLEARVPGLLAAAHVPGLSIALIRDARVAWSRGFGVTDAVSKAPVGTETRFEAGSVSKTVFAYAVMKLAEKGVLDLDTPLTKYISERWITDDPRFDLITARHVLSHTSGLPNWRSNKEPLRIHFAPGSRWQYSGEGYSYLQLVVAHLTGRVHAESCETLFDGARVCATDIDAYLKTNLLRPFGMSSSGYVWDVPSAHTAGAHDRGGKPTNRPGATPIMAARYGAAGGLSTTATEYAKFLIEVLDPKPSDAFRLTRSSRDEMIRPQVKVDESSSWALGWQIRHQQNENLLSHGGDNPGFKALVLASVPRQTGYVILTNGDNGGQVIGDLTKGDLDAFVTGRRSADHGLGRH